MKKTTHDQNLSGNPKPSIITTGKYIPPHRRYLIPKTTVNPAGAQLQPLLFSK